MAATWAYLALFVLIAVLAALGMLLVRAYRSGARQKEHAEPACGNCGYPVRGLTTLTCPECGADFREAGIATPQLPAIRRPLGAFWHGVIWTIVLPIPAGIASAIIIDQLPRHNTMYASATLTQPASNANYSVYISVIGKGIGQGITGTEITVELTAPSGTSKLLVNSNDTKYIIKNPSGQQTEIGERAGLPEIIALMKTAGLDISGKAIQDEAALIRDELQESARQQTVQGSYGSSSSGSAPTSGFRSTSQTTSTGSHAPPWAAPACIAFWAVVWLLGLRHIIRKSRGAAVAV